MASMDIRLVVGFPDHPKTVKLQRRAGAEAVICLLRLWLWARVNRPDGDLSGLDDDDVEIAAGWSGEPGTLVDALRHVGFLDGSVLHDWGDHQGWACGSGDRSVRARFGALVKHHGRREAVARMRDLGQLEPWMLGDERPGSADAVPEARAGSAPGMPPACRQHAVLSAPSPSPSPSPSPLPTRVVVAPSSNARVQTGGSDTRATKRPQQRDGGKDPPVSFDPQVREPTPDEVRTVAAMRGYPQINAELFIDTYRAVNWEHRGTPIRDWRALITRWREREKLHQSKKGGQRDGGGRNAAGSTRQACREDYNDVFERDGGGTGTGRKRVP